MCRSRGETVSYAFARPLDPATAHHAAMPTAEHTVIPFACPACHLTGKAARRFAGRSVRCPRCAERVTVPPELADPPDTVALELTPADPLVNTPPANATAWIGPPRPRTPAAG